MAWTTYQCILALTMVVTGSLNTLSTKWADEIESENSAGNVTKFNHPFLQADGMFVGEMLCFIAFKISLYMKRRREASSEDMVPLETGNVNFNPIVLLPAAIFDMLATSTMYVGLTLTYPSSFQMLRGSVIIFTGLLSILFLRKRLKAYEWIGMITVILGLSVVGASDFIYGQSTAEYTLQSIITGDTLIVVAQILTGCQMVYEEKFLGKYSLPPLQVVGWEGIFGFTVLSLLLIPMYFIHIGPKFSGNPREVLEDALDGFTQLGNSALLTTAFCGTILSIAFFNFAGVSVTKELSATTRMVLDSVRTLVVWGVSIGVKWQNFYALQVLGFFFLVIGMFIYNDIILRSLFNKMRARCCRSSSSGDSTPPPLSVAT